MRSMFSRLISVFLAAILVFAAVLSAIYYTTSYNQNRSRTLNTLKRQGQDLAYLASESQYNPLTMTFGYSATTKKYIEWKLQNLYSQYSSYCLIINSAGRVLVYIDEGLLNDQDVLATLDSESLSDTLSRVVAGEEVELTNQTDNGTMFTVAIPWKQNGRVMGAVVIQTAAQAINASFQRTVLPVLAAALAATILAVILFFWLARPLTRPLRQMERSANAIAQGNFSIRAPETGSRETRALARAFNDMATQMESLESSRRDFIANVSHELRSPLTSIQGYLQGMLDGTFPPDEQPQCMSVVLEETQRLSKLVSGLLSLSRMEREDVQLNYADFDLNELTRRALITKETQIDDKHIDICVTFEQEPCLVCADRDQITQVLVNLLDNALKFTPETGRIALSTRAEGGKAVFRIADSGPGIRPEDAPHIFDRFYKADKAHTTGQGTGLGLAICKRIIEKHGERIELKESDSGAVFEFTLKLATETGDDYAALPHPAH